VQYEYIMSVQYEYSMSVQYKYSMSVQYEYSMQWLVRTRSLQTSTADDLTPLARAVTPISSPLADSMRITYSHETNPCAADPVATAADAVATAAEHTTASAEATEVCT
jgi:hypothetical protein